MLKFVLPCTFSVRFLFSVLIKINKRDHDIDIRLGFFPAFDLQVGKNK